MEDPDVHELLLPHLVDVLKTARMGAAISAGESEPEGDLSCSEYHLGKTCHWQGDSGRVPPDAFPVSLSYTHWELSNV